ncbi:MAG: InlB B-repeat-containing protein, partial [Rhodospirillaceae bacterium]
TKPDYYSAAVTATFGGYFQHVLWRPTDGTLTNLSTCGSGVTSDPASLQGVHSTLVGANFPSTVVIANTGTAAETVTLGIYDARDGTKLGTYAAGSIPAHGQAMPSVSAIEQAAHITPASGMYHYVVRAEGTFTGFLQNLVNNASVGVITDMTTSCGLAAATASTTYSATFAGSGGQSGTLSVQVGAAAAAASLPIEKVQSTIERASSSATASGALSVGASTYALTGTYDSGSGGLNLSGSGYAFAGTIAGDTVSGSYSDPNSGRGAFSGQNATSATVTTYCGTYHASDGSGSFNIQISGTRLTGVTSGGAGVTLSGTAAGTSFSGVSSQNIPFSGATQNDQISGTYHPSATEVGTFSGSVCAVPAPDAGSSGGAAGGGTNTGGTTGGGSGSSPGTGVSYGLSVSVTGKGTVSDPSAHGINCKPGCTTDFDQGTSVVLTATPESGETFQGWEGACSGTQTTCTVAMNAANSVSAAFSGIGATDSFFLLNLSATMNGGLGAAGQGTVTSSPSGLTCQGAVCSVGPGATTTTSSQFLAGKTVTLTATPSNGATFTGWSGDCSGTGLCTVTMSQARNVTAAFAPGTGGTGTGGTGTGGTGTGGGSGSSTGYLLNFSATMSGGLGAIGSGNVVSSPGGLTCQGGNSCSVTPDGTSSNSVQFTAGSTITLIATAFGGATFVGWSGDCSGTAVCTLTMNAAKTVRATFTPLIDPTSGGTNIGHTP